MATTYEPIATTTLGSAASSITFSSIPSTYTDLRLVFNGNCSAASRYLCLTINSDTSTNYSMTSISGDGTSAISLRRTSDSYLYTSNNSGASITIPQLVAFDIFSYSGSTYKTVLMVTSNDKNGSGTSDTTVGLWRSTATITSLSLLYQTSGGNINAGTTATLYGIKAA